VDLLGFVGEVASGVLRLVSWVVLTAWRVCRTVAAVVLPRTMPVIRLTLAAALFLALVYAATVGMLTLVRRA
jgi:hypothetical protein